MSDVSVAVSILAPFGVPGVSSPSGNQAVAGSPTAFSDLVMAMTAGTQPSAQTDPALSSLALPVAPVDSVNLALAEIAATLAAAKPVAVAAAGKGDAAKAVADAETKDGDAPADAAVVAMPIAMPVPLPQPAPARTAPPPSETAALAIAPPAGANAISAPLPSDPLDGEPAQPGAPMASADGPAPNTGPVTPATVAQGGASGSTHELAAPSVAPQAALALDADPTSNTVPAPEGRPLPATGKDLPQPVMSGFTGTRHGARSPAEPVVSESAAPTPAPQSPTAAGSASAQPVASLPDPTAMTPPSTAVLADQGSAPVAPKEPVEPQAQAVTAIPAAPQQRPQPATMTAATITTAFPDEAGHTGGAEPAAAAPADQPAPSAPVAAARQPSPPQVMTLVTTGTLGTPVPLTEADAAVIAEALAVARDQTAASQTAATQPARPTTTEATAAAAAASQTLAAPALLDEASTEPTEEPTVTELAPFGDDPAESDAGAEILARLAVTDKPEQPAARPILPVAAGAMAYAARLKAEQSDGGSAVRDAVETIAAQSAQPALPVQQAAATTASIQSTLSAVPVAMVAVEISRMAKLGETSFQIRLDPPELGRIDVTLELSDKGEARAHLTVERRDTLDLMARDQRALERALRESGFEAKDGSVSLSLRNNGSDQQQQRFAGNGQDGQPQRFHQRLSEEAPRETPVAALPIDYHRPRRDSLLDVRI